jgi:mannose-6-phosphate isomerase
VSNMVIKPWGTENRWAVNDRYLGKILYIKRGHRLSLQYHEKKDETIFVLEGTLRLHVGDRDSQEIVELVGGNSYRIEPGVVHRFEAPREYGDVTLIEVSSPEIDDVVRLEDDYKRI